MEDREIVRLYFARAEAAVSETAKKYGAYCAAIAKNILHSLEDTEECLSDTWLSAWNAIPPQEPRELRPFLGRIARNAALDRWRKNSAAKRSSDTQLVLEELGECVGGAPLEDAFDARLLGEAISNYLAALPAVQRQVFLRRYWYCDQVAGIAKEFSFTESKVKSMLRRVRLGLQKHLEQEGFSL